MTEAEKQALALIRSATITPLTWASRIEKGYKGKRYAYEETNYFRALKLLRQVGPGPPPPPPPPASGIDIARSVIFLGQNPIDALSSPHYYKLACTADLAYRSWYEDPAFLSGARAQGRRLFSWGDCHTTFPPEIKQMAANFGFEGWYGECESAAAFDVAYSAGAKAMVGNLSSLRPDQISLVAQAKVFISNELYRNCTPGQQADWHNANAGVGGNCIAFYGDGQCSAVGWSAYPDFIAHRDSVYGPGTSVAQYQALP